MYIYMYMFLSTDALLAILAKDQIRIPPYSKDLKNNKDQILSHLTKHFGHRFVVHISETQITFYCLKVSYGNKEISLFIANTVLYKLCMSIRNTLFYRIRHCIFCSGRFL